MLEKSDKVIELINTFIDLPTDVTIENIKKYYRHMIIRDEL